MLCRRVVKRFAAVVVLLLAGAAVLPMSACGSSNDANQPGGVSGGGGANGGGGGDSGSGGMSAAGGGGGVAPAPTQDPTTNKWMCGTHVCACNDGIDNDNDQTVDNLDPNCAAGAFTDDEAGSTNGGNCGTTQCSNCIDDDGDGNVDGADIECTGALDNDESSFATGISGDNSDACKQDCFFDGNSGSGNDGCLWNLKCDPASPGAHADKPCPYDSSYKNCDGAQSQACIDYCRQYTPNGCDCFGCCTVFVNGTPHDVKLMAGCSVDTVDDPNLCPACTKETSCANDCGKCEYCLGRNPDPSCTPKVPDGGTPGYPDSGYPPPPVGQCPAGIKACAPGDSSACNAGDYCLTGCCTPPIH